MLTNNSVPLKMSEGPIVFYKNCKVFVIEDVPMSVRETLNQSPRIAAGSVAAVITIGGILMWWQMGGGIGSGTPIGARAFYTTEIKTADAALNSLFEDSALSATPIEKGGKRAYRARVWSFEGQSSRFVSHFERYDDAGAKRVRELIVKAQSRGLDDASIVNFLQEDLVINGGLEVLFPGEEAWMPYAQARERIEKLLTRDGSQRATESRPE